MLSETIAREHKSKISKSTKLRTLMTKIRTTEKQRMMLETKYALEISDMISLLQK